MSDDEPQDPPQVQPERMQRDVHKGTGPGWITPSDVPVFPAGQVPPGGVPDYGSFLPEDVSTEHPNQQPPQGESDE